MVPVDMTSPNKGIINLILFCCQINFCFGCFEFVLLIGTMYCPLSGISTKPKNKQITKTIQFLKTGNNYESVCKQFQNFCL